MEVDGILSADEKVGSGDTYPINNGFISEFVNGAVGHLNISDNSEDADRCSAFPTAERAPDFVYRPRHMDNSGGAS